LAISLVVFERLGVIGSARQILSLRLEHHAEEADTASNAIATKVAIEKA
jgi:hypothetical protein